VDRAGAAAHDLGAGGRPSGLTRGTAARGQLGGAMQVVKRDGRLEPVRFDKITQRLRSLCGPHGSAGRALDVDVTRVAAQVCVAVHDGVSTSRLDELAADIAAGLSTEHPDYGWLAARILVSNLQKNTSEALEVTYGERMRALLGDEFLAAVGRHAAALQAMLVPERDYDFDYFGFKTLEKLYLTRVDGAVVERPQHMWLRVAVALWLDDLDRVRETYEYLSTGRFTHASPTLFNAGMKRQQLCSWYVRVRGVGGPRSARPRAPPPSRPAAPARTRAVT
jgi:hypothetical protein